MSCDVVSYVRDLSQPQDGDVRPMNIALEALGQVARRVGRSLHERRKARRQLEKGRYRVVVDTLFMSDDEKGGFLIGVAEWMAKVLRSYPSNVSSDRLITELTCTESNCLLHGLSTPHLRYQAKREDSLLGIQK